MVNLYDLGKQLERMEESEVGIMTLSILTSTTPKGQRGGQAGTEEGSRYHRGGKPCQ